jgi:hypothetical protein
MGEPKVHEVLRATTGKRGNFTESAHPPLAKGGIGGISIGQTFSAMTMLGSVPGLSKDTLTAFIQKAMMLIMRPNEGELS